MTAEIAILNKSAVALAADSLVTMQSPNRVPKTYIVNKLFTLSKYHPVGVMVYGNAELLGVPWETTIKIYRKQLRNTSFETVEEYARSFAVFLAENRRLFPQETQADFFRQTVAGFFVFLRQDIDARVKAITRGSLGTVTRGQIRVVAAETIEEHWRRFQNATELRDLAPDYDHRVRAHHAQAIKKLIDSNFAKFELSEASRQQLDELCGLLFSRNLLPATGISGIVVAGFGECEPFPAVVALDVFGVLEDRLIYRQDDKASVNLNHREVVGAVLPFAQRDVVDSFLTGIDPHFRRLLSRFFKDFSEQLPSAIAEGVGWPDDDVRKLLTERLSRVTSQAFEDCRARIDEHIRTRHIDPLMSVVGILPKEELAAMAEALVNLTTIKRKMSLDIETVGGPIDVAVISKGDGFVWIKRKHYFDPKLNPQFFENYFRD
jgi:hypothetical protein